MNKKVLITGINGQIGSYLRDILTKEAHIYGLIHKNVNNTKSRDFYLHGDILEKASTMGLK